MSINRVQHYDPQARIVEEIRKLESEVRQLKYQQAPTIYRTGNALVQFDLDPVSGGRTDYIIIAPIIAGPNNEVLFAIPEFTIFRHDDTGSSGKFPHGSTWNTAANDQYHNILDFNFWYSWALNDDAKVYSRILLRREDYGGLALGEGDNNRDGTTPGIMELDIFVRFRFITPGSS